MGIENYLVPLQGIIQTPKGVCRNPSRNIGNFEEVAGTTDLRWSKLTPLA